MRASRGFTLIELLIVVVIIGLIAILTYPSMQATLAEGRLYASTRSVVETLTFARLQAIMRNQAHEVTLTFSPTRPGGSVTVRRYTSTRCATPLPDVVRQATLDEQVALAEIRNDQNAAVAMTKICFRPNGRAAEAGSGTPIAGELRLVLRRFEGAPAGATGWPLYVKMTNMGLASLAKLTQPLPPPGGGN